MNEPQAFSNGRICAYGVMRKHWPRVDPYLDMALDEVLATTEETIEADGSYLEGPSYMAYGLGSAGQALCWYARARGFPVEDIMPGCLSQTADFAEAVHSTDRDQDVIPICDATDQLPTPFLTMMAALNPDSRWVQIYRESSGNSPGVPSNVLSIRFADWVPEQAPPPRPFVRLEEMGVVASNRALGDHRVKLLLMGNKAGAGHTHEDKGSFVLEFGGDTFAMDPGKCSYGDPLMGQLKQCQRHNMLVPYGTTERPRPECPLHADVKPRATGDYTSFRAGIDATPGWDGYYARWERDWESPRPEVLRITDRWELENGKGVEFCWNTRLPVRVDDGKVHIEGENGRVVLAVPDRTTVRVDELRLIEPEGVQRRIAFRRNKRSSQMCVEARLEVK